jgi:hypothetical protein
MALPMKVHNFGFSEFAPNDIRPISVFRAKILPTDNLPQPLLAHEEFPDHLVDSQPLLI